MKISKIENVQLSFNRQNKTSKTPDSNKTSYLIAGGLLAVASLSCLYCLKKKSTSINIQTEFLKLCKSLKNENYVASSSNVENGIFAADLHSHSNHSDGYASVKNLMEQVSQYADKFYKKTGKKFTFALTDHDTVSGVAEAQKIIKETPNKYKHLNFVPGVELSFSFVSNNEVKSGELLAYFIEPDSKEMQVLVKNLRNNRQKMIDNFIKTMGKGLYREELNGFFLNNDGETFAYNLHYRLRNYAQIKNRINKMAIEQHKDPRELYKELMNGYVFENPNHRVPKPYTSPEGLDAFIKRKNIHTNTAIYSDEINQKSEQFFPKIVDGKVVSDTENSFEKIIDTLKDDKNVVLAFAHPYFTAKNMTDYKSEFKKMLEYSDGRIRMAEIYHQSYPDKISIEKIEEINQFLKEQNLIAVGGRDNHKSNFM